MDNRLHRRRWRIPVLGVFAGGLAYALLRNHRSGCRGDGTARLDVAVDSARQEKREHDRNDGDQGPDGHAGEP